MSIIRRNITIIRNITMILIIVNIIKNIMITMLIIKGIKGRIIKVDIIRYVIIQQHIKYPC